MKRFISTLCLLVGASVASYAGVINSPTGNMTGPNHQLQNFDNASTFPVGSFTSLPAFNMSAGTLNTNVTIQAGGSSTGTLNTGNTASIQGGGNATFGLNGGYLSSYAGFPADTSLSSNFIRTLNFTFTQALSEFLFTYAAHDGTAFYTVNGLPTQYALAQQPCTANCTPATAGFVVDSSVTSITSFTITFSGNDRVAGRGGDVVFIDNLRLVGPANGSVGTNPETSGGGGVIPEPSTYALMGAGLLALGYARRKK